MSPLCKEFILVMWFLATPEILWMRNNLSQIVYKFLRHFLPEKRPGMGFENLGPAPGSDSKWLCNIRQIPKPALSSSAWYE